MVFKEFPIIKIAIKLIGKNAYLLMMYLKEYVCIAREKSLQVTFIVICILIIPQFGIRNSA